LDNTKIYCSEIEGSGTVEGYGIATLQWGDGIIENKEEEQEQRMLLRRSSSRTIATRGRIARGLQQQPKRRLKGTDVPVFGIMKEDDSEFREI